MRRWAVDPAGGLWLREVAPGDIATAARLAGDAFRDAETGALVQALLRLYGGGPAEAALAGATTALEAQYYVLVRRGADSERTVGLTGLYRPAWAGRGIYWLGWFAIDPSCQRHGLGRRLLEASLRLAAMAGGRRLCVETASTLAPALRLYQAAGFEEHGRIADYWGEGSDLVILSRTLADMEPLPDPDESR